MLTVALDTCFQAGGVALAQDGELLGEVMLNASTTHSRRLLAAVDYLLEQTGRRREEISGVAVTVGPGFFTGLRIGLATAQGLALGLDAPMAGVSSLRLLAHGAAVRDGLVWAIGDARRGLLYAACFRAEGYGLARVSEYDFAVSPERLLSMLEAPATLVGPGARLLPEGLDHGLALAPRWMDLPRPGLLALIGHQRLSSGQGVAPEAVRPNYCRPSDAEVRFGLPMDGYHIIE